MWYRKLSHLPPIRQAFLLTALVASLGGARAVHAQGDAEAQDRSNIPGAPAPSGDALSCLRRERVQGAGAIFNKHLNKLVPTKSSFWWNTCSERIYLSVYLGSAIIRENPAGLVWDPNARNVFWIDDHIPPGQRMDFSGRALIDDWDYTYLACKQRPVDVPGTKSLQKCP